MFLSPYFNESKGIVTIEAEQASQYAKQICKDFNPLHDVDHKRFCVPGDLLFSIVLAKFGLSESMHFQFAGMAGHHAELKFSEVSDELIQITDGQRKLILEVTRKGKSVDVPELIESFIRTYVGFSGQNFPNLMMPLLAEYQVMFNPSRPLVMYDSMSFELESFDFSAVKVELSGTSMETRGKRADQLIQFDIQNGEDRLGHGTKKLIIGGLKPYVHEELNMIVATYEDRRNSFLSCVA